MLNFVDPKVFLGRNKKLFVLGSRKDIFRLKLRVAQKQS